jgi:hypothetical protein
LELPQNIDNRDALQMDSECIQEALELSALEKVDCDELEVKEYIKEHFPVGLDVTLDADIENILGDKAVEFKSFLSASIEDVTVALDMCKTNIINERQENQSTKESKNGKDPSSRSRLKRRRNLEVS